jgi:hypothetical protein
MYVGYINNLCVVGIRWCWAGGKSNKIFSFYKTIQDEEVEVVLFFQSGIYNNIHIFK